MRVVIVGGTGNISTSIVRLLLEKGHEVTIYNRGQRGAPPSDVRVIQGDRSQRSEYEAVMQHEKFDVAIDMICFTREDAESNVRAFRGVQQFIQTSTTVTYGVPLRWLPATEDHPLLSQRPYGEGKNAADAVYLEAYYREGFPVTILKPSTTHGPQQGLIRQIAWDYSWIDRIRKGKPILVCGNGTALHQYLHVDDAALGFVGVIGKTHCLGQVYNLVDQGYTTWADYHRTAMRVLGREVELVGIPLDDLMALGVPRSEICRDIFAHHAIYSSAKIFRDVPEFRPRLSLEAAMQNIIAALDASGRISNSDDLKWEDQIIAAQRRVRETKIDVPQ